MKLDGENIDSVPTKSKIYSVAIDCGDTATGEWDYDTWGVKINNLNKTKVKCSVDFTIKPLIDIVALGDYIEMTPTSTSYTIPGELTGCAPNKCNNLGDQIINPSELDLWRVININEDGTIELISEYISNEEVFFYGKTGYLNFVGALNTIAKQYENEKYTIGSRHMGFDGQIEYLDPSKVDFSIKNPWDYKTKDNANEEHGGGDIKYIKDRDLLWNALKKIDAKKKSSSSSWYWIASRLYMLGTADINYYYYGRNSISGENSNTDFTPGSLYWFVNPVGSEYYRGANSIRPIVILKPSLKVTGSGTSEDHYKFVD